MKKYFSGIVVLIAFALLVTSCKKSNDEGSTPDEDLTTITEVGNPVGAAVKKTIDANGGQLSSADGTLQVIIPAGALAAAKEISIQPITNHLGGGIGNAYRILPHGTQFAKPVKIVITYKVQDLARTLPEFLDIAYQDADGSWLALTNAMLDKTNRKITVSTDHFSDWGFFKSLNLEPAEATVAISGNIDLKVTTHFPYLDPDHNPGSETTVKVLKNPRELRPHEVKGWTYQGEGILISRAAKAYYTAPDHEPSANPEAVVCNIQMHRKGQFMLVSNITVLGGTNVKYLKVDEDYKRNGNAQSCWLYIYGSFGNDPGVAKRSVTINSTQVDADLWTPTIIRCKIDRDIYGPIEIKADGKRIATSVLRRFEGSFVYTRFHGGVLNSGSSNALKENTEFRIVYRGFGAPPPAGLNLVFAIQNIAAFGTRADYTLSGAASVTTPGTCGTTTSVNLSSGSGTYLHNTIGPTQWSEYLCQVKDINGGIEIKLEFRVDDVVKGVRVKRTNCNGSSLDNARDLGVGLEGFSLKPINLAFTGTEKLSLMNTNELKSGRISSSILIEAWDGTGNPSHYETDGGVPATFKNKM